MSTPVTPRKTARYGWTPDLPDARDHLFSAPQISLTALPPSADLRSTCPPVYNQEQIGSCTANAIGAAFEFETTKQGLPDFMPSRLFIYYNERAMEGSIATDSGAQIRDGVKSVAKLGVCPETEWPYDGTQANSDGTFPAGDPAGEKPTDACYKDALNQIEVESPGSKLDFYIGYLKRASSRFVPDAEAEQEQLASCERCGAPTTDRVCAFCKLVERASGAEPVHLRTSP